ncbi:MAG: hypothetical protein DRJ64_08395 [Thermoprotei archaeon]|nr:MAG: hypothetical protein DRJ64_08395 [Thermoprotei archaeon]
MMDKILSWLEEMNVKYTRHENAAIIPYESTIVEVRYVPWGKLHLVEIIATVAIEVTPNIELFKFLLEKNAEIPFGKFTYVEKGLDAKPTIFFSHSLLAEKLDKEEFDTALNSILSYADEYDEKIAKMGAGKTFREYSQKVG